MWGYLRALKAPPVAWFTGCGLAAAVFVAGVLLMRALVRRGAVWSGWLALPAVWVSYEYMRNILWPHGSASCLAYSQLNFLPFLQLASLTGPWGMSFVLMLFSAGLALGIHLWNPARKQAIKILGTTLGVVAAVLIFGAVRLAIPPPGPQVTVGLVASDRNPSGPAHGGAATMQRFEAYAQQAQDLIARGAQVVVMPEGLGVVLDPDAAKAGAVFQELADRTGAVLVVGTGHVAGTVKYDEARIYSPKAAVRSYDKEHLLPPLEDMFTPGTSRTFFSAPGKESVQMWGVAICKDMDFTEPARAYGRADVGLMLVPGGDFRIDAFWHGHIAVMRAVEDGFSLVRSARKGLLTVADDRWRIVAETASNSAPFATVLATVPAGYNSTLFLLLFDGITGGGCGAMLPEIHSDLQVCATGVGKNGPERSLTGKSSGFPLRPSGRQPFRGSSVTSG
jgi:apolipoprotein N-acyltransferase